VSSNQRVENYLNFASICPHLTDAIIDRVEDINTHYWLYGHTQLVPLDKIVIFIDWKTVKQNGRRAQMIRSRLSRALRVTL